MMAVDQRAFEAVVANARSNSSEALWGSASGAVANPAKRVGWRRAAAAKSLASRASAIASRAGQWLQAGRIGGKHPYVDPGRIRLSNAPRIEIAHLREDASHPAAGCRGICGRGLPENRASRNVLPG